MYCEVIVDILSSQVDKIFDYLIDDTQNLKVGQRVLVPFGNRFVEGYILKIKNTSQMETSKLKKVIKSLDDFSYFTEESLSLMEYMIKAYNLRYGDCLRLFVPSVIRKNIKEKFIKYIKIIREPDFKLNKTQEQIVLYLKQHKEETLSTLNEKFSSSSIKTLIKKGILGEESKKEERTPYSFCEQEKNNIVLTDEQQKAVSTIIDKSPNTFLLFGVTASGKTEVYINVIDDTLKRGKSAILLVPEIGLTPQLFKRFTSIFGQNVAIIHSGLSDGEKLDQWLKIKRGECKVVIGARSAIFAPVENLGLIIMDEEHDTSYYSQTNPRYYTKDIAKFRCNYYGASLILGSATPSIESFFEAKQGKTILLEMKKRAVSKKLPEIHIVDMMSEIRNGNDSMFSRLLQMKLKETIDKNEQAILFINRRGYSSFLRCMECGYIPKCTDCDISLVYHKEDNRLKCHYCGNRFKVITKCPHCGSSHIRLGAIGTEQVEAKLKSLFPNVPVFRMDNDTTSTKNSHINIIEKFNNTKPSILVGTQMVSKGHNFNSVSLVGIIDADLSLHYADFRSTNRTFNLLTQVSGRAGRTSLEGEVVLQTYCPKHFAYQCVKNYSYEKFYEKEINLREVTHFPPFSKIVRVLVTSEDEERAKEYLGNFYQKVCELKCENHKRFIYLGAMKSPLKRSKRQFRYQILMRIENEYFDEVIEKIFNINNSLNQKNVTSFVEIDPQNLS